MKRTLLAALATVALASPTFSADLPAQPYTKAPVAVPVTYNWTGCYVGVNGGYAWNRAKSSYQDPNTTPDPINGIQVTPGNTPVLFVPVPSPSEKGWLGGGSAGCNWQSRQWVFGIEADVDGANISGNQTTIGPSVTAVLGVAQNTYQIGPGTQTAAAGVLGTANEQVSLRWLSTVRGRLGFAVQDRLLLFATGGLAVGGG